MSLRRLYPLVTASLLLVAAAQPAHAQYFGGNKVQYKHLTFEVVHTDHFDIYYSQDERAGVDVAERLAERWYARLADFFHHDLRGRQPLILYGSQTAFQQTNVIDEQVGEGVGGVTEPVKRRIVLPLG